MVINLANRYKRIYFNRLHTKHFQCPVSFKTYIAKAGSLTVDGAVVGLSAVPAEDRPHIALTQRSAQGLVHGRTAPDSPFNDFIAENVTNEALRRRRTAMLKRDAVPFDWLDRSKN